MTTLTIAGQQRNDAIVIPPLDQTAAAYCVNGGSAVAFSGVTQWSPPARTATTP